MTLVNGFLLGIASGGVCLAYCAPVLVPYLLGEAKSVRANLVPVGGFLGGRLAGYLTFAVLAWFTHTVLVEKLPHRKVIFGVITIGLALLLIVYGFMSRSHYCPATSASVATRLGGKSFLLMPIFLGFLTGVNVCPPFLLAFSSATQLSQLWQSLLFFAAFFGMPFFASQLVAVTGLHVHPLYTGGEVAQTIDHERYLTLVHRPVFDGLIGQRSTGFVQIEWQPKDANLPETLDEQIDFDQDGKADFRVQLNTGTDVTTLEPLDRRVLSAQEIMRVEILRVNLRNRAD
jgi:hypothetical protein